MYLQMMQPFRKSIIEYRFKYFKLYWSADPASLRVDKQKTVF